MTSEYDDAGSGDDGTPTDAVTVPLGTAGVDLLALYRRARPYLPPPGLRERVLRSVNDSRDEPPDIEFDDRGFPVLDERPSRRTDRG